MKKMTKKMTKKTKYLDGKISRRDWKDFDLWKLEFPFKIAIHEKILRVSGGKMKG